jgi:hypothetical protein
MNVKGVQLNLNLPRSALRFSFNLSHLVLKSFPTTLSTRCGSVSPKSMPFSTGWPVAVVRVARFFVHDTLGHETLSSVPSVMARVQQELRHGVQLEVSAHTQGLHSKS